MSEASEPRPFDVCGPVPTGVTVLEASAGTGKTYTIAALAARYVAEGTPLHRMLLVTFTRMATGELRERVRERLVSVEHGLERALASGGPDERDEIVRLLAAGTGDEVRRRRDRLTNAISNFDAATIATTHSFCQEVLSGLGIAGDVDPDVTFVEDIRDLVDEVVDDLYVRRFHRGDPPTFARSQAAEIADIAIANPEVAILPATGEVPAMRVRLASTAREELERRKRALSVMAYDDLLTRLAATLQGDGGEAAAARLRERYPVVLVDEFQDTDPVQWDIMRRAFGESGGTLVLIGDPKQAIYAFRGADVYAYLEAAQAASTRATLSTNWRSDQGLIDAYDKLFGGAKLGHPGIVYRRVRAAEANRTPRLSGAAHPEPLRVRVVHREDGRVGLTRQGYAKADSAREHVAQDLATDLVALLNSGAEIERRNEDGGMERREQIRPGHAAVLVQTNRHAALVREALEEVGIPSVINGAGSVFGTEPAREWLRLLDAIERPSSQLRAHSAAMTSFIGWRPQQVATADDDAWEQVHRRLHEWGRLLRVRGVASLLETITSVQQLPERVLTMADGERWLTDLRHVGQLLHSVASAEKLGSTALTAWLRRRIAEAEQDTTDEERSRRLESDAEAVQVLTIHRSKGLEFPVIYLPFLWCPSYIPDGHRPVFFHDPEAGERRTIDVSLEGAEYDAHRDQHVVEERGEDLRLAYVALTRAQHQAVVWWAGSWDSRNSPLGRLLFERDDDGNVAPSGASPPDDPAVVARLKGLAAEVPGCISVERSTLGLPTTWAPPLPAPADLTTAVFDRGLDWRWRRTSYSDITSGAYEARVASEPEVTVVADEPAVITATLDVDDSPDRAVPTPSLLAQMPVGAAVGTFVHRVMEATDFAAANLAAELGAHVAAIPLPRHIELGDPATVVAGLCAAIETPLGPVLGDRRLRDLGRQDRIDEMEFELPLVGGDDPSGRLELAAIGRALDEHLPSGDPLAGYAARLTDPELRQQLRGYLTGSLDLVVRVNDPEGPRFAVLDYKTNWLAGHDDELTTWHYRPSALAAEMQREHYGLQAILYTAALHRYLRWRVPDYTPERHLGGVLYLFVRGMAGPATPRVTAPPCGVFAWRPPGAFVEALSELLDRGASA